MSFLIDPPLLVLSGLAIYFLGQRLDWSRQSKIVVGSGIVLVFVIFSSLLYADLIKCVFPFFSGMNGCEFMLHTNFTGISKAQVPSFAVVFLFLLYPFWMFAGYATALLLQKRRRESKETYSLKDVRSRDRRGPAGFAVARNPKAVQAVEEAVAALGGMDKFVSQGDRVLIKINICGGVPEIKGTFTSTDVAGVIVDMVKAAGGEPTLADADMVWTKFWRAAEDSGWKEWARQKGVRLLNLSETKIVRFDFGKDSALGVERVSKELIDADVIISLPTMKTHLLTGVTIGMKNMYGTFPEVDKAKYHRKQIEDVIYEINSAFRPTLTVIDGTIGGEAIGPLSCKPVNFQTVVASGDVVAADSVACQLMGYDPMDITHILKASEHGLGDAGVKYDLDDLPYEHGAGKDGNWDRPDPRVKDFYEWGIELLLKLPGWETLFNVGADFILYDLARLPVLKYFTPALLQLLNDVVYLHLSKKETEESRKRRWFNVSFVAAVALFSLLGFYLAGYPFHSNLAFDLGYLLAILLAAVGAARMSTRHLLILAASAALFSLVVEITNTTAGLLSYAGTPDAYLFVVGGWIILMISILYLSDLLRMWFLRLGLLSRLQLQPWRTLPFLAALALFLVFMYWEGYLVEAGPDVWIMYAAMAALGFLVSSRRSAEWNLAIMVVSISLGGFMELLGSLAGFWQYRYGEPLAVCFALSWAINSFAVYGLPSLFGVDISACIDRLDIER
ncbi:MAG TPA: DUF362 domain-containing protein [Methanotrichaceae archaeon]|nr:DUF362 domain-containing protein [Methanotrichaceae archaeon]